MESEAAGLTKLQVLSEYSAAAALSEYMIARSGFLNASLVSQISNKIGNADQMVGFRDALQIMPSPTSLEALAFIAQRLGSIKAKRDASGKVTASQTKLSIICVKGKQAKRVNAVNAKCPAGYTKNK